MQVDMNIVNEVLAEHLDGLDDVLLDAKNAFPETYKESPDDVHKLVAGELHRRIELDIKKHLESTP